MASGVASAAQPLKVGLVGAGNVARNHHVTALGAFTELTELIAVCDIREDAARAVAASVGQTVAVYTDLERMLEIAALDALDICTPHELHAAQTIAAARAGKHVLVEKPMACSIEESEAMVAAAEAAGVTLMVGQVLRYVPSHAGAREVITRGDLGRPWYAHADDWFPAPPQGAGIADGRPNAGGVLHVFGSHHVDLFRSFFGEVATVRARCWSGDRPFTGGPEDRAVATFEFESGVVAHVTACWSGRIAPLAYRFTVLGDAGSLHALFPEPPAAVDAALDGQESRSWVWLPGDESRKPGYAPMPLATEGFVSDDPWLNEVVHFARCVRDGTAPHSSGRDNLGTVRAIYGCFESARRGREIHLSDL